MRKRQISSYQRTLFLNGPTGTEKKYLAKKKRLSINEVAASTAKREDLVLPRTDVYSDKRTGRR
jgi:hypothetical protein